MEAESKQLVAPACFMHVERGAADSVSDSDR